MNPLHTWLLLGVLFIVWILWGVAAAFERAVEHRTGSSFFPAVPVFPLLFWGISIFIDLFWAPWGRRLVFWGHMIFTVALLALIIRDGIRLRRQKATHGR